MKLKFILNLPGLCHACKYLTCTDFGVYTCNKSGMIFYGQTQVTGCNVYELKPNQSIKLKGGRVAR